jgi:hypothetical protein
VGAAVAAASGGGAGAGAGAGDRRAERRAALLARALVAVLAVAPWLGLLAGRGASTAGALLGHAVALVAAMHGAGAVVEWAAGNRAGGGVWLRVAWGAASLIAAGGVLMLFGAYTAAGQTALLFLGVIAHSAELARRARGYSESLAGALRGARRARWLVSIAAITAVALLHVLGNVGAVLRSPWDGELHLRGQLRLLADTGGLGDAVGFPRAQELGGGVVLSALAGLGEPSWSSMLDGLGLALLLALVSARLLAIEEEGPLWAGLGVLVGMTFARVTFDASLFWVATALLLAGAMSLQGALGEGEQGRRDAFGGDDDEADRGVGAGGGVGASAVAPRRAVPAVVIAAALITLHHALLPCGLVLLVAALWPHRRRAVSLLVLAALALVVVAPYVLERSRAAAELPATVRALIAPRSGFSFGRLALFALVTALLLPLLRWLLAASLRAGAASLDAALSTSAARWSALALATGFAGVLSQLWVTRPYASRYTFAFAVVLAALAVVRAARRDRLADAERPPLLPSSPSSPSSPSPPSPPSLPSSLSGSSLARSLPLCSALLSLFLLVSLYEAQERRGGLRWSYRWAELADAAGYVLTTGAAAPPSTTAAALSHVPAGATVAIWLGHPERLDHSLHRILDLRTPSIAALRARSPARFARLLTQLAPDYLLHDVALPDRGTFAGRLCLTFATCVDDFSQLAQQHRVLWSGEGLRLLMLRR